VGFGFAACATGAVTIQNARVSPKAKSKAETKVANLAGCKLLVAEEEVFFISCFWM
jgi:hypothetical protein